MKQGWIAVDLDGTIAKYDEWRGEEHIGEPIPAMLHRVKVWLAQGKDVRIFTARVYAGEIVPSWTPAPEERLKEVERIRGFIEAWCEKHIGQKLPITNTKDYAMVELWDDRAVQVEPNTGWPIDPRRQGEAS